MHKKITRTTSELREIEMIKFLEKNKNHFIIRLVALKNYTDQQKDLLKIKKFISTLKFVDKFEVLPFHQLAMSKYDNLQIKYVLEDTKELTNKQIKKIENIFIKRSK
jgi:pyruvate formate lyase activating enzyme